MAKLNVQQKSFGSGADEKGLIIINVENSAVVYRLRK